MRYCKGKRVAQGKTGEQEMVNNQKEIQVKLTKGLLDMIVLQFLNEQPMHGYQIITKIRKSFGVYFGPSTVYPLLGSLEKKGYVTSVWNMDGERPRKVYKLTNEGQELLNCTEKSLNLIVKTISTTAVLKNVNGTEPLSVVTSIPQKKTGLNTSVIP
ncbi:MAG: PadR family transcriptional regulator [Candidatus Bathyarchaeia archaeon]